MRIVKNMILAAAMTVAGLGAAQAAVVIVERPAPAPVVAQCVFYDGYMQCLVRPGRYTTIYPSRKSRSMYSSLRLPLGVLLSRLWLSPRFWPPLLSLALVRSTAAWITAWRAASVWRCKSCSA